MRLNPISWTDPGLLGTHHSEIRDCLAFELDTTEHRSGYSQSEREARSYVHAALPQVGRLLEGVA